MPAKPFVSASTWQACGIGLTMTSAMCLIRVGLDVPLGDKPVLVMFTLPVMLSAYLGGLRAGLLATALASTFASLYLLPQKGSMVIEGPQFWNLGFFILAGIVMSTLNEALHRSRRRVDLETNYQQASKALARKQADEAHRETDALLRTIHLHSIVSITDRSGRITDVNDSFCKISGYSREELIGQTHRVVNSGEQTAAFWEDMWRDIAAGRPWRGEICNRTKAGALYWVDSIIAPFVGEDGRTEKYVSIRTDVTPARQIEERLRASEERYRALFEYAPDGIIIAGADGVCLDANASICRMLDYGHAELIGMPASDIVSALEPHQLPSAVSFINSNSGYRREWQFERKNGSTFAAEVIATQMPDGNVLAMIHDVTEQKRFDSRFRRLVDSDIQGVMFWNAQGAITNANDSFLRMLGYSRVDLASGDLRWTRMTPAESPALDLVLLASTAAPGDRAPFEMEFIRKDGSRVPVMLGAAMFDDSAHDGVCFVIDVTQNKQYEKSLREATQKAEQANLAKSEFLANMSHEIRSPMNAVIGLSYLLAQTRLEPLQRSHLAKIQLSSKALLGVLNNVLDLSKIEAGELIVEQAAFDLSGMLREVADVMSTQAMAKGIDFELRMADDLPSVLEGDVGRVQQVLTNLLTNGIKFTDRGQVVIDVGKAIPHADEATTTRLTFQVRDTGIGISPDVQSRLFMPFAQADASITRRFGGTGLGLSIVKRLVGLMGGDVRMESTPGVGSLFSVSLPFALASPAALSGHESPPPTGRDALRGLQVLVVDDSDINLDVTQRILELEGARVLLAINGQEAIESLRSNAHRIDVVLMDVQMPVVDGYEATRRIRLDLGLTDLPIIALTAGALISERQRSAAAGMNAFIVKPIDPPALVSSILRLVGPSAGQTKYTPSMQSTQPLTGLPWPEIIGIDTADVRERLGGDQKLFRSLLKRLLDEYPEDTWQVPSLANGRMHKLRGSAGMLGAMALQQVAGDAEAAYSSGDIHRAHELVSAVVIQLSALRTSAGVALMAADADPEARPNRDSSAQPHSIFELVRLLRRQHISAIDHFEAVAPQLRQLLDKSSFAALNEHIENLQFGPAAALLEDAPLRA